ncbi:hypothetical protein Tco_0706081 [Tanacetum coccineum]|uniref:Uncharacterized protein n=1 Tax=Tanacetum coccineum TaxID=301880 RepID=A0ABQ4Y8D5_9ASTR
MHNPGMIRLSSLTNKTGAPRVRKTGSYKALVVQLLQLLRQLFLIRKDAIIDKVPVLQVQHQLLLFVVRLVVGFVVIVVVCLAGMYPYSPWPYGQSLLQLLQLVDKEPAQKEYTLAHRGKTFPYSLRHYCPHHSLALCSAVLFCSCCAAHGMAMTTYGVMVLHGNSTMKSNRPFAECKSREFDLTSCCQVADAKHRFHFLRNHRVSPTTPSEPLNVQGLHFIQENQEELFARQFVRPFDIGSPAIDGPPVMPEDPYLMVLLIRPRHLLIMSRVQTEEEALPTAISPTADSSGYVLESDPEEDLEEDDDEDLEEDPADYPANRGDDGDDEDESFDDDEYEEAPSAERLGSFVNRRVCCHTTPHPAYHVTPRISIRDKTPISLPHREEVKRLLAMPTPPSSPLSPWSSLLP